MEKDLLHNYISKKTKLIIWNIHIDKNRNDVLKILDIVQALQNKLLDSEQHINSQDAQTITMILKAVELVNQLIKHQELIAKRFKEELCAIYYGNKFIRHFEDCIVYNRLADLASDIMEADTTKENIIDDI